MHWIRETELHSLVLRISLQELTETHSMIEPWCHWGKREKNDKREKGRSNREREEGKREEATREKGKREHGKTYMALVKQQSRFLFSKCW